MTQEHRTYFLRSRSHLPHALGEVKSAPTSCRINYININGFKWKWKKVTYFKTLYNNLHQTCKPFSTHFRNKKKTTASNVPIVAIDVTTSLSLTGNRDWVLCIEYEVFI